jgi:NAD(P)-dependent dehydrogenase (short-subunit alcohol dehydrogenase family)
MALAIDLTNKVVVITGGGGVLCGAMAKALAKCKAKVAILDLKKDAADKVAEEINSDGGQAIAIETDVLNSDSLQKAKEIINNQLDSCDILINGAGGNHPKGTTSKEYLLPDDLNNKNITTFFDLDKSGIEVVFNLNLLSALMSSQVFAKDMLNKKGCTIINISSMNAFTPLTKIPAYSAAKAALSNFTQWLAVHMSKIGIRVNAIAPGFFLTEQNRSLLTNKDGSFTERAKKIINNTPMERFGSPEELVGTILWLADEKSSSFITGAIIPIDGGFSVYSGV